MGLSRREALTSALAIGAGSALAGCSQNPRVEDLVLIGKDGPELLNTSDDRFIVV